MLTKKQTEPEQPTNRTGTAGKWMNGLLSRLKTKSAKEVLLIILIAGLVLSVYAFTLSSSPLSAEEQQAADQARGDFGMAQTIEQRLSDILSKIRGAGDVDVMVTLSGGAETDEARQVLGVVVVAQGAKEMAVRMELTDAVRTALDIDAGQVAVFERP